MLTDFKDRIMRCRRGDYSHMPNFKDIDIKEHTSFLGFFISGSMIAYLIIWFTLGLILTPLFLPIIWQALWDSKWVILSILSTNIASAILTTILNSTII